MSGGQSSKTILVGHRHCQFNVCLCDSSPKMSVLLDLIQHSFCHSFPLDAFEAFSYVTTLHGLQEHPGVKAIILIGGLVAEAACDEKLDGLYYNS